MRSRVSPLPLAVLLLGIPLRTSAGDAPEPRMLIEKAIAAAGGREKLEKAKAISWKVRYKAHEGDKSSEHAIEWVQQLPGRQRMTNVELGGFKRTIMWVLNGDKAWITVNGRNEEVAAEVLMEGQERAHAEWVASLTPLSDRAFVLDSLGEKRVDGNELVGVRVSFKGRRDINLYFGRQTGLLQVVEIPIKVPFEAKEHMQEVILSEYKEVDGVKRPTKVTQKWDGKVVGEGEIFDYKILDRVDDDLFAKPK